MSKRGAFWLLEWTLTAVIVILCLKISHAIGQLEATLTHMETTLGSF